MANDGKARSERQAEALRANLRRRKRAAGEPLPAARWPDSAAPAEEPGEEIVPKRPNNAAKPQ